MAVGAGVALLFAPCSGKEARGWLTRQATDLKRKTNNAIEQGKSALMYAKREIQSTADSIGSHDGPSARTMRS
jgi:gas vesicle protein